ncbi:alpha-L-rhamnosidase-related protein [Mucilaginibacter ginsenosidivorax]|uniref:Alpha-L-rhamnosidase six-hairpin glycosidase domain-containing protein n=1 Tax=Mucilaginibacter ginsenosidivorax TaxID=862126 RepID=A0A5B8W806_9SPHI|nr:hypothetical protein [Mucilaginibacter ginsenosidivorax]QEC79821.1 hypothetical protein FSB76_29115 [Mucilaginibacter ginsenosidivorax]
MPKKIVQFLFCLLFTLRVSAYAKYANTARISPYAKTVTIAVPGNQLAIVIDYSEGCIIKQLRIKGKNVLSPAGIYTGITTKNGIFLSSTAVENIKLSKNDGVIKLSGLTYGDGDLTVDETWEFKINNDKISWTIIRSYNKSAELEDMSFPKYNFSNLTVWKGGILDNGGMVWCKYLKQVDDTYGVHTGGVTFWNAESGNGLRINTKADNGDVVASKFSHSKNNEFTSTQLVTDDQLQQRHDLSRFVSQKADIFAPFKVKKGVVSVQIDLQYVDYFKEYSKGKLPGIDAIAVRELMNTTGRYGVVDNNIIGANGWLTNWKCLHEPFFAQIGMALGDKNYTRNMSATLDQERDEAILPDGRVLSRWHNAPGDEMPGTYNPKTGYYEAMWGYTVDSQTGYVINASEQFDINGDLKWLRSHQNSCENALEWLIKRDANHNGIFEAMNNNIAEKKASDWLDIVWASYENAFVNAQMYEALNLWADCEKVLGNKQKAAYYAVIAARLKTVFNKPIEQGGFWSQAKKQYVYWRDNDGSVHGDNLVTPVNFAAIAFGLCDDPQRTAQILDQIEARTVKENLFHWPLCFDSFKKDEVSGGNWPFPNYENGDIFPTWGYLGVRAYAGYDKGIALKYIHKLLNQYKKDGLSSQRYSRATQLGLGDDILAGISTSITALYRDIYGLRPKWNRMGIEPKISAELNGTTFSYTLRDTVYQVKLGLTFYEIRSKKFSIKNNESFGVSYGQKILTYYCQNLETNQLLIKGRTDRPINLIVHTWKDQKMSWSIGSQDTYWFIIKGLAPGTRYTLTTSHNDVQQIRAKSDGTLTFMKNCDPGTKLLLTPI